jgi:hypothetical protein
MAQGGDPVSAIANAVGSLANTVTSFVSATAQKYGLQKGLEVGGVESERAKELSIYSLAGDKQKFQFIILGLCLTAIVLVIIFKKR